ncbi:hypothetical protein P7K49_020136 [Saguinus oedipus]|uniref:EGF-like domain-containing protein n=1 Tax=Saguinus oedipus TaxID=9490 RepID=A0ABQ9UZD3_SAGOE|nr:hypothetical protein P7K49_020136 [Saguinus oedipus]
MATRKWGLWLILKGEEDSSWHTNGSAAEEKPGVCNCVHGVCNSGLDGDGTCECYSAYTGPTCDKRKYY